ncbi:CaiB/BaiF CoA transferase family protein [Stakelama marina]|uniref:CoA transferase n=1 Tax=Stakelama marina TaxID=2826939 RepID=A0A8T4IEW7_9SPHN|nr:CaiB/BaiF CoA-transferase family protein [Stakelama marina]MBR0553103.1 CoA transferase [Stakelama marina]
MTGVLFGVRIVELASIGPGPFCGMMLADHGAEVIRVERPGQPHDPRDPVLRSRTIAHADLKTEEGRERVLDLVADADGLIEGFRPGVLERLELGPDVLLERNPKLVIGRMTGWGQTGPLAQTAGHDINYIALSGVLGGVGPADGRPVPPMNLVGDYGGGAMMLAFGMVSGILHARTGGAGQVIDCAMTDGSALLTAQIWGLRHRGLWHDERGANLLDGGAYFYGCYRCSDGEYVAIGAIEPQFHAELLERLGLTSDPDFAQQMNPKTWPRCRERLDAIFATRTRDEWAADFEGSDICFAPVLAMGEAPGHGHNVARETFIEVGGAVQPAPAPRFSRTPARAPSLSKSRTD